MEALKKFRRRLYRFALVRVLIFDKWFRIPAAGFALLLLFFSLFLPRIWTVSPPDFVPVVTISGLDLAQAWSLARAAKQADNQRDFKRAHHAWMAAIANNPANPSHVRGALNSFLANPSWQNQSGAALQQAFWLLKLTATNATDLELALAVFEKAEQHDLVVSMLRPKAGELTPAAGRFYLKSLFHTNDRDAFHRCWREHEQAFAADPELQLYRAAANAAWQTGWPGANAWQELEASLNDPQHGIQAARFLLTAAEERLDLERYTRVLDFLAAQNQDRLLDHINHWRLIAVLKSREDASRLLQERSIPVTTTREAIALARLYADCRGTAEALKFLKTAANTLFHSPDFWTHYAGRLFSAKEWTELKRAAIQMRNWHAANPSLRVLSYFFEWKADLSLGRDASAAHALRQLLDWDVQSPDLVLLIASNFVHTGLETAARDLLLQSESALRGRMEYWVLLFDAARRLKEIELMRRAGRAGYALRPEDPVAANHLLSVLLLDRDQPSEAIRLSFALVSEFPDSTVAQINHAAALLLNERASEAEAILNAVDVTGLSAAELAIWQRNCLEACLQLGRHEQAQTLLAEIDRSSLYPPQVEWLDRVKIP